MERSDFAIKLTSVIVFLAIVCYMVFSYVGTKTNPMKTVMAVNYTVEDSSPTEGYIVREETVIGGDGENVAVTAEDGQKIGAGGVIAVAYQSTEALDRASQIYELQMQVSQIDSILSEDGTQLDKKADETVMNLAYAMTTGNFKDLDSELLDVETYIYNSEVNYSDDDLKIKRDDMQQQIQQLEEEAGTDTVEVTSEQSGTFSSSVDGYENIDIESVTDITPDTLSGLFSSPAAGDTQVLGKMITDTKWYYAATVDFEEVANQDVGDTLKVRFNSVIDGVIDMSIENIGPESDGRCVIVLSSSKYITKLTAARNISADIVNSDISGIRIPKEAMHLDEDDDTYIYVISGLQAQQVYVDVIGQSEGYYIADSGSAGLREGTEIIVRANDLYDGKVIE